MRYAGPYLHEEGCKCISCRGKRQMGGCGRVFWLSLLLGGLYIYFTRGGQESLFQPREPQRDALPPVVQIATPTARSQFPSLDDLARKDEVLDRVLKAYSPARRRVVELRLSGQPIPVLANMPKEGDFGTIAKVEFRAPGQGNSAQCYLNGHVIFLGRVEVDRMTPGLTYGWKEPFEMVSTIEYTTPFGRREKAPYAIRILDSDIAETESLARRVAERP